jgi:hypothetical protein
MNQLPPPTATRVPAWTLALTRCTSRGSNPDHRILSPVLSPLKVLVQGRPDPITRRVRQAINFSGYSQRTER